ncbi:hypothetical protein M758_5G161400 [Ceratodon purpureus]|nr:hypothetical protein M758_5G161400 [Ceratodon purpureus]
MLAQLLIRRVSSKQTAISANVLLRCTSTSSKCCPCSPVKETTSRASRTTRELHTFVYKIQPRMGLPIRPLMKGYASSFAGNGFSHGKLLTFTATRSLWGQGSLQKTLIRQGRWRGIGVSRMILPKQDTVRGFSTSNDFGQASLLLTAPLGYKTLSSVGFHTKRYSHIILCL